MSFSDNVEWHVPKTKLCPFCNNCYLLCFVTYKKNYKEQTASLKRLPFKLKSQICFLCQFSELWKTHRESKAGLVEEEGRHF